MFEINYQCFCQMSHVDVIFWGFFFCFPLNLFFVESFPTPVHWVSHSHLTYLLRLLSRPSLAPLSWLKAQWCIIHQPDLCVVVPRCVWVKMFLPCRGDASVCVAGPWGHYNLQRECVLPRVYVFTLYGCHGDLLKACQKHSSPSLLWVITVFRHCCKGDTPGLSRLFTPDFQIQAIRGRALFRGLNAVNCHMFLAVLVCVGGEQTLWRWQIVFILAQCNVVLGHD